MGIFLAASAFKGVGVGDVVDGIVDYAMSFAVDAIVTRFGDGDRIKVFPPAGGWTVATWPQYSSAHVKATRSLSHHLGTTTSTVEVYDGDFWLHHAHRDGELVDRFASQPDYFTAGATTAHKLRRNWAGNPLAVAHAFGTSADVIAPCYAYESDPWEFLELWHRLGISYPLDVGDAVGHIRLEPRWSDRLPVDDCL